MRSRAVNLAYCWEPDSNPDNCTYDFLLTLSVEPTDPGDYDTPSSLGGVELTRVSLESVTTETETHTALTEPRRAIIEKMFEAWLTDPAQALVLSRIEERASIQAEEDDAGAKEEAETRRAEARRERAMEG